MKKKIKWSNKIFVNLLVSMQTSMLSPRPHTFLIKSSSDFCLLLQNLRFSVKMLSHNFGSQAGGAGYLVCPPQQPIPILIDRAACLCALHCTVWQWGAHVIWHFIVLCGASGELGRR